MKNNKSLDIYKSNEIRTIETLVHIKGHIDILPSNDDKSKSRDFKNQGSFILDIRKGDILYQSGLGQLLGYSEPLSSLKQLVNVCYKEHIPLLKHIINTYKSYCETHFLAHTSTALNLTCSLKNANNSYVKVLCHISVFESHENQLTKLLIKFTDIDFISSSCDMAWTLQSNKKQELLFKKIVAAKYTHQFSARELEIVNQMQYSLNNAEIGEKLFISSHTVATHRKNLYKKSNLNNTESIISYCRERGLI